MIAYWPAMIKTKKVVDQVGAFWDFLPTFAEMAQQPIPTHTDGISILPTLTAKGKQKQHEYLYWEFHEDGGRQAVRMGNWKAVRENVIKNSDSPIALYDLSKDPAESKDLASEKPEMIAQIKTIMQNAHLENKDFPFFK